jgi:hypothetical protein
MNVESYRRREALDRKRVRGRPTQSHPDCRAIAVLCTFANPSYAMNRMSYYSLEWRYDVTVRSRHN